MVPLFATKLLTWVTAKLLGSAARAADLVLDADTKLVQLESWRLGWLDAARARALAVHGRARWRIITGSGAGIAIG